MSQYPQYDPYPKQGGNDFQSGAPPSYYGGPSQNQSQNPGYANYAQPDEPLFSPQAFTDVTIRHAFIKKVYSILSFQLAITIGFIALFVFVEPVKLFFQANMWIQWVILAFTFVIVIVLACCNGVARKYPINIILLFAFTLMESVLLGIISASYDTDTVLIAAGITALVVVGITIFAFQTKIDFTGAGIYLFVALLILFGFGIVCAIIRSRITSIVYSALGAGLFSMYLIFDTQLMLGKILNLILRLILLLLFFFFFRRKA